MENMSSDTPPLRRDAERNRQRLLAAAREVFAVRGFEATLDDVARHAGVGSGTAYRRFPNKEALIDAIFEDRIDELAAIAGQSLAVPDGWDGLVFYLTHICEEVAADQGLFEALFGTVMGAEHLVRARERLLPLVAKILARAQETGRLRADLDLHDLPMLMMTVATVALYARQTKPEIWRRFLTVIIDGLMAERSAPTPLPVGPLSLEQAEAAMLAWPPRR